MIGVPIRVPIETIAKRFHQFAKDPTVLLGSPLYAHLSEQIAEMPEILALVEYHQVGQPEPNLLFGAVHQILLTGVTHALQAFFAPVNPLPHTDAIESFVGFCRQYADNIRNIVTRRLVQTNEVGRSALLLPSFYYMASKTNLPLALLEVGTSAGLNLHFDRFHVQYVNGTDYTPMQENSVKLLCEVRGNPLPPMNNTLNIQARIGLDLNPMDVVNQPDDEAWLRALIWPQDTARMARYDGAVATMKAHPITLIKGNALDILADVLAKVPTDTMLCVFHSFVLYQFSDEMKTMFFDILAQHSKKRPIFDLTIEGMSANTYDYEMFLRQYNQGNYTEEKLANVNPHGKFVEWLI
jgi:hypothetical protein